MCALSEGFGTSDLPGYHRVAVEALDDRDAGAASEAIRNDISSAAAVILARLGQP